MRITTCFSLLIFSFVLAFTASPANASKVDCININTNIKLIEELAETGQYRKLNKSSKTTQFDYKPTRTYQEYLTFAQRKIANENPKAALKCPIETVVTRSLEKPTNMLTVSDLVAPFELKTNNSNKAILLVHGLTDSPYLFHDLAAFFANAGFNVRTLLLPGHGTAPEALTGIEYQDWQKATEFAINRTLLDFEQVYLGGFSTGGALILDNLLTSSQALNNLKGVILWAPASQAKSSVAWAAQIVDWVPFLDYTHKGADIDFAKYESFPLNAGAQVHDLMNLLATRLEGGSKIPDIPLLTITTEVDSTIETNATIGLLAKWHNATTRNTKQQDTLFYFGSSDSIASLPNSVTRTFAACRNQTYCDSILNVAHTSLTNAPTNIHYGWQGSYRNCETAFNSEHYKTCKTTTTVTLGETTSENLAQHPSIQRLTFNPSFEQMTDAISNFVAKTQ